jgi:hypothetical protein
VDMVLLSILLNVKTNSFYRAIIWPFFSIMIYQSIFKWSQILVSFYRLYKYSHTNSTLQW